MSGSRSHSDFFFFKSSQNGSKPVLIFWSRIQCVFLYTLLKVVNYYDLSVLSMSVLTFQKKSLNGVFILDFWKFLTLQALTFA